MSRDTSTLRWLDHLDACYRAGYKQYEQDPSCPRHKVRPRGFSGNSDSARDAFFDGWDRARHEYEDAPPEE